MQKDLQAYLLEQQSMFEAYSKDEEKVAELISVMVWYIYIYFFKDKSLYVLIQFLALSIYSLLQKLI